MTTYTKPGTITPQTIFADYQIVQNTSLPPLERLRASDSLRRLLRAFETTLADEARRDGATWDDVAGILDISKQAAYQRFSE
jgi:hypothetical protein